MPREDVEIKAVCHNGECDMFMVGVYIGGRFAFDGEFEAHDEGELLCSSCDELLELEYPDDDDKNLGQ
jgi:hypothetical protein